ncbi:hypothetical protein ACFOWU_01355 [Epilithonimonas zeae]|uniref:Uncharacterized protein n=1 Tax=Epilithonimonas zeae TaxID=1416779 RepID=A0A1N6E4R1_9FLAO|nr:hypothetical protein [Epilithonimonas zeae]SIN77963.1 hypothetical protein SAMN05444409_0284 [Epilithonimonas zeae]
MMKTSINNFFKKWYNPIILIIVVGIICLFLISNPYNVYVFYFLLFLPFILILISGINATIKIVQKNYKNGLLQLFSTLTLFVAGVFMISIALSFYPYDFYADNLEIPKNIKIEKPIDLDVFENGKRPSSIINKSSNKIDFQLYNINQPGIYTYDVWTDKKENGFYYLKAIEITKNDTLSSREILNKSKIHIRLNETNLSRLELKNDFTIYEGDWGKPYSAKFELWFHNDSLNTDKKLISKNYIIEGWMR